METLQIRLVLIFRSTLRFLGVYLNNSKKLMKNLIISRVSSSFRTASKGFGRALSIIFIAGIFSSASIGQEAASISDSDFKIEVTHNPIFPIPLRESGVMEGKVRVLVAVDSTGVLRDWIAVEATHRSFVRSVDRVIEDWHFIPKVVDGVQEASTVYVDIELRVDGIVLSNPGMVSVMRNHFDLSMISERDRHKVYSVRDLDEIPRPVHVEKPLVPEELISDDAETFVFEFYIDRDGEVHVPLLVGRDEIKVDERILVIVQESLRKWKFTPPTVNGRKVTVKVAQPFDF